MSIEWWTHGWWGDTSWEWADVWILSTKEWWSSNCWEHVISWLQNFMNSWVGNIDVEIKSVLAHTLPQYLWTFMKKHAAFIETHKWISLFLLDYIAQLSEDLQEYAMNFIDRYVKFDKQHTIIQFSDRQPLVIKKEYCHLTDERLWAYKGENKFDTFSYDAVSNTGQELASKNTKWKEIIDKTFLKYLENSAVKHYWVIKIRERNTSPKNSTARLKSVFKDNGLMWKEVATISNGRLWLTQKINPAVLQAILAWNGLKMFDFKEDIAPVLNKGLD